MKLESQQASRGNFGFATTVEREEAHAGAPARTALGSRGICRAAALLALAGLGTLATLASAARADDPKPVAAGSIPAGVDEAVVAYNTAELQAKEHLRTKAADALVADVDAAAKTANGLTDLKMQSKWRNLIGTICSNTNEASVQRACIKAIGETKDPSLFHYIRPFLQQPNPKETPPLLEDCIAACAKLVSDDAVPLLLNLVDDSKVLAVSQCAMKAFAGYGNSKRTRVQILRELAAEVEQTQPGIGHRWDGRSGTPVKLKPKGVRSGEDIQARWAALAPELTKTLNAMTGQNCPSAEEWFKLIDRYKSDPGQLFSAK